jgi:hypothetical protein
MAADEMVISYDEVMKVVDQNKAMANVLREARDIITELRDLAYYLDWEMSHRATFETSRKRKRQLRIYARTLQKRNEQIKRLTAERDHYRDRAWYPIEPLSFYDGWGLTPEQRARGDKNG